MGTPQHLGYAIKPLEPSNSAAKKEKKNIYKQQQQEEHRTTTTRSWKTNYIKQGNRTESRYPFGLDLQSLD